MVHVLNITSGNLYCYGGNNPVRYVDPDGQFITNQFIWATVQTFGGIVELSAGFLTEGVSMGVSTYAVLDGVYNIADGVIGMVSAACDKKYDGAISETSSFLSKRVGFTKEQQEAVAAVAGFIDAFIDAKATKCLSLISKGKTSGAIIKATKAIDKINDLSSKSSFAKQGYDSVKETVDVIKEYKTNTNADNN